MSAIPMLDEDECVLWTGYTMPNGYGRRTVNSVSQYAHRYAYQTEVGPIPEGMVIDHLCRVRNCVNVRHMEVVTLAENTRRGCTKAPEDRGCGKHGAWDRVTPLGKPYCKRCSDESNARRRARAKELVSA